ncbi:MAG: valine--tRNA ligase, partial [Pseudomonadota bacterium]
VADDYADPTKGSGAVKITPAHDFNDFQVGKRHGLESINILDAYGKINENGPADYVGMDRFVTRKKVVEAFEQLELLKGIEKTRHMVPHGDRSGVVIEPWLTDQWYVDAETLAKPAIAAVENGDTVFEPKNWEKTYFEWMRNIQPWCVSRQLWWGHRIPAWYDDEGNIYVEETAEAAQAAAGNKVLRQDEDVLDTWFSSGLWPFSTLGWPEKTSDLERFYPTHTLVTGFDIIFFWVARMMMMGLHFTGQVPFQRVVINALVRDASGAKMSKSKGNVMDPLELIDQYGCDALRFTLTAMSGQARDIKLSTQRIEGYRNFGTKLWNATRFTQMNGCVRVEGFDPSTVEQTINKWVRGELVKTAAQVTEALEGCSFDGAANALYRFIWNVFCDWYLELAKPILNGSDEAAKAETQAMVAWTLDQILVLLHPVMPFITEELWDKTAEEGPAREGMLITTRWPEYPSSWTDAGAEAEIGWLVELVTEIRSIRAEMNVPPGARVPLTVSGAGPETSARLARHRDLLVTLARLNGAAEGVAPAGSVPFVVGEATASLVVADYIDVSAERARLTKEIAVQVSDIERVNKKLGNPDFLAKAKEEVIEESREKLAEAEAAKAKLEAALGRLASVA